MTQDRTVLIVNDLPEQLALMSYLLRKSGYTVLTAYDGQEGLAVAESTQPHLIISDVTMPVMDGIEMCRQIRRRPELRNTPILLVSAIRKDNESVIEGLNAGADDYLEAPYDPMLMVTKVAQMIERKLAEDQLTKSEERYRDLVENAHDIIYSHDLKGNYTSVNRAGEKITGYAREEILRMNLAETVAPDYLEKAQKMISGKLEGEEETVYELEILAKDGRRIAVEVNTRLVVQDGVPVGVQGIARDITERKQLEQELRHAQKMDAVGRLAGGIAHDFNNYLTAIAGYSDLALRRMQVGDPLRRHLIEIKKAGARAATLTNQLLAFSRKQVLQPIVLDLNATVVDMERMLHRLIGENITLRTALSPDLRRIKADPGQISQVILNLVVNARDAMTQGGQLTIETENVYFEQEYATHQMAMKPGPYAMLAVSDTGTGMDKSVQSRIFEPFFTTKEASKGTGLGLSTVYGIVKQSGGTIWFYSEVGRGTTFKVFLPITDGEAQEYQHPPTDVDIKGEGTILLAEDEDAVRNLVREVLESHGYTVLEAANGGAALLICERHKESIDLLLTDVVMPEMSGRELAERLAELRPEMKVMYMSGYTDNALTHHKGLIDGSVTLLQKPFTANALARKVREVLLRTI